MKRQSNTPGRFDSLPIPTPGKKRKTDKPKARANAKNPSIAMLDKAFSIRIRTRDTIDGVGKCITCQAIKPFVELDCGHYIGRQFYAVRWNDFNASAQCRYCNRFNEGMKGAMRIELVKRFGEEEITKVEGMFRGGRKPKGFEAALILEQIKTHSIGGHNVL